jgi:ATP phosphoribosyltransferase regulatory subunit
LGLDAAAAGKARLALDHKDAAQLAAVAGPASEVLGRLLAATGPADAVMAALGRIRLPAAAEAMVAELAELVREVRAAAPALLLTVDPGEFRGFEYHSGISFSLFARGVRGELGGGGRYLAGAAQGPAEPATGFTVYLDSLMRALPGAEPAAQVFVPAGTPRREAARLRAEGWAALQGLAPVADARAEARRLGCSHCYRDGRIEPLA